MKNRRVTFVLPEEVFALLDRQGEGANATAKEAFVMGLVRDARISQGKAAELLGVTRWEILDAMVRYRIPSGPTTPEELQQELELARRAAHDNTFG